MERKKYNCRNKVRFSISCCIQPCECPCANPISGNFCYNTELDYNLDKNPLSSPVGSPTWKSKSGKYLALEVDVPSWKRGPSWPNTLQSVSSRQLRFPQRLPRTGEGQLLPPTFRNSSSKCESANTCGSETCEAYSGFPCACNKDSYRLVSIDD